MFASSRWFDKKKPKKQTGTILDNNIQNEEIIDRHMSPYVFEMMTQIR